MLEGIAMLTVLAGMGFYFIKSTDIPKDMKDRSAQSRANYGGPIAAAPKKYAFDKKIVAETKSDATKLAEIEKHIKRQSLLALQTQKIDELTLLITSLEQEIKENNSRNAEIQAQINVHLETLRLLKDSVLA